MRLIFAPLLMLVFAARSLADASIDSILDQLHARGNDLKTLAADVTLMTIDTGLGDEDFDTRTGHLVLERKPDGDTRIRITFTKRQRGKRVDEARKDYLIDGPKLVERDWSSNPKKETVRVIRKPGEKLDLFKLGEGPFPLPIGQPREDVLKEFDVKPVTPAQARPELAYLELVPKSGTSIASKFKHLIVGTDKSGWPVEVETLDPNETKITRARLDRLRVNDDVKSSEFELEPIDDSWDRIESGMGG